MTIYIDFNLNVLLQLFFSLSKQIIFFSAILTNNNLPLKIYCENIVTVFLNFSFLFFILCFPYFILFFIHIFFFFPSFFLLHTRTLNFFFLYFLLSSFSLPLPPHTWPYFFSLFPSFVFFLTTSHSRTFHFSASLFFFTV